MTIEEMRRIKQEKGYSYAQIAQMSGVPLGTVQKIFGGETSSPRYDTLTALEDFFKKEMGTGMVKEAARYSSPNKTGGYTIKDYYALPDDKRVELIDGVFYDMAAPAPVHQRIVGELHRQIANFIFENKGSDIPFALPVDVRLDCDDKTMIQPDVIILCDTSKLRKWGIMGAPDFVVEVLSPSTKRKDCFKKLDKYMEAGVREYWMIDPDQRKVIVYEFEKENYPVVYGMDGQIPVGIYGEKLFIDMSLAGDMIQGYPVEDDA
ncbi:MAG: Uma2 family endonuclease [Lachnospiraceae bacterium]|nr:Uma2 family endonuclease [Lachnospiraceae bacterium]